jgi:hypothetical protein
VKVAALQVVAAASNRRGRRGNYNHQASSGHGAGAVPVVVPPFEGSDPLLKGFIYDIPNGKNMEQLAKTTKEVAIGMAGDMGNYAVELSLGCI